jgi:hypothetical protein
VVRGSKGAYRDLKSQPQVPGGIVKVDILKAVKHTAGTVNFYCLPGRAGGSPDRIRPEFALPEATIANHLPQQPFLDCATWNYGPRKH